METRNETATTTTSRKPSRTPVTMHGMKMPGLFALEENETWSFEAGRPVVEVVCLAGEVWVTLEGDPEDHVLAAGATFSPGRKGRLAMMAFRPARLALRPCG